MATEVCDRLSMAVMAPCWLAEKTSGKGISHQAFSSASPIISHIDWGFCDGDRLGLLTIGELISISGYADAMGDLRVT